MLRAFNVFQRPVHCSRERCLRVFAHNPYGADTPFGDGLVLIAPPPSASQTGRVRSSPHRQQPLPFPFAPSLSVRSTCLYSLRMRRLSRLCNHMFCTPSSTTLTFAILFRKFACPVSLVSCRLQLRCGSPPAPRVCCSHTTKVSVPSRTVDVPLSRQLEEGRTKRKGKK